MHKITQYFQSDKPAGNHLLLAVDVSSKTLDIYTRYHQNTHEYELSDSFSNDLSTIDHKLAEYYKLALAHGYVNLSIVVEPSGCYEKKLTSSALQKGYSVWTVNPERMYKAGMVHHGDDGKSDPLDGKVLYMMAQMGNVRRLVPLTPQWQKLRQLGLWMEDATLAAADARIHIGTLRRGLFVDWDQSQDLSWGPTGRTLQEVYGFDPWHITRYSVEEFIERMRGQHKGLPRKCLTRIWQQAQRSCSATLSQDQREGIGAQLSYYWDIWKFHDRRKQELAEQMVAIVEAMDSQEWMPRW